MVNSERHNREHFQKDLLEIQNNFNMRQLELEQALREQNSTFLKSQQQTLKQEIENL